jgi:hypothetical protein
MQLSKSSQPRSRTISTENHASSSIPIPNDLGISAHLFQACIDVCGVATSTFKRYSRLSLEQQRALIRVQQSLRLWGQRHRVASGGLDATLQRSKHLQMVTIQTLRSVLKIFACGTYTIVLQDPKLTCLLGILRKVLVSEDLIVAQKANRVAELLEQSVFVENNVDESDNETSGDGESSDSRDSSQSLEALIASLRREIRCLNDLNASLKSPALDLENNNDAADATNVKDVAPHHSYSSSIQESFPNASFELVERLGKYNLNRYQHLLDLRSKADEETEPLKLIEATPRLAKTEKSGNDDSGYGTLAPPTAYAPSVASSRLTSLASGDRSKYPPLPGTARSGAVFDCLACGREIIAKETRQWR